VPWAGRGLERSGAQWTPSEGAGLPPLSEKAEAVGAGEGSGGGGVQTNRCGETSVQKAEPTGESKVRADQRRAKVYFRVEVVALGRSIGLSATLPSISLQKMSQE
jgi:hypothetical protein